MTTSEDKIIAALRAAQDDNANPETLHSVLLDMARNQSIFLRIFPWITMLGTLIIAIYAAAQFFASDQPKQGLLYATIFICDVIIMAIVKLWLYLCWARNSIMREIKRVELRLLVDMDTKWKSK